MKSSVIAGVLLIALGVLAIVYKNVSYTSQETVLQIGSLKATAETEKNIPIPNVLGIAAIIAGVVVIAVGGRGK
jgi:hypothetical protein